MTAEEECSSSSPTRTKYPPHLALHYLAGSSSVVALDHAKRLLDSKTHAVDFQDDDTGQLTPLHIASHWGNLAMCQLLIHYNANSDAKDEDGNTPLMLAEDKKVKRFLKKMSSNAKPHERKRIRRILNELFRFKSISFRKFNSKQQQRPVSCGGKIPDEKVIRTRRSSMLTEEFKQKSDHDIQKIIASLSIDDKPKMERQNVKENLVPEISRNEKVIMPLYPVLNPSTTTTPSPPFRYTSLKTVDGNVTPVSKPNTSNAITPSLPKPAIENATPRSVPKLASPNGTYPSVPKSVSPKVTPKSLPKPVIGYVTPRPSPISKQDFTKTPTAPIESESTDEAEEEVLPKTPDIPLEIRQLSMDQLKKRLEKVGISPGPMKKDTRKIYEKRLIVAEKQNVEAYKNQEYSNSLDRLLRILENGGTINIGQIQEDIIRNEFCLGPIITREKNEVSSFCYILIDISKIRDQRNCTFKEFVDAAFYVGKGKRARPLQHLVDAAKCKRQENFRGKPVSDKLKRICKLWRNGHGVVSLHVFLNIHPNEAFIREAAMIDAFGVKNLTNLKGGEYSGNAKAWTLKEKTEFGAHCIYSAWGVFRNDRCRPIFESDVADALNQKFFY